MLDLDAVKAQDHKEFYLLLFTNYSHQLADIGAYQAIGISDYIYSWSPPCHQRWRKE